MIPKGAARILFVVQLCLAGCVTRPAPPRPSAIETLAPSGPTPWRLDFGEPQLADLQRAADLEALDIKSALARIERADAQVAIVRADQWSQLTVALNGAIGGRSATEPLAGAGPSLALSYQIDIYGRLASAARAAEAEHRATREDLAAVRLVVGAETTRAYLALQGAQAAEQLGRQRLALAEDNRLLVETRRREGAATIADVAIRQQAEADIRTRQDEFALEAALQRLRLESLAGPAGDILPEPQTIPPIPISVTSGVVDHRPDVRSAYHRLEAADALRAQAIAAARPSFAVTVSLGAVDPGVVNLLDSRSLAWAAAAALSHDLLDGGRAAARVRAATAEADIAEIDYMRTVRRAWQEVRSALNECKAANDELSLALLAQSSLASTSHTVAVRHDEGAADGLAVNAARDDVLLARINTLQHRLRVSLAQVGLALAMGGQ